MGWPNIETYEYNAEYELLKLTEAGKAFWFSASDKTSFLLKLMLKFDDQLKASLLTFTVCKLISKPLLDILPTFLYALKIPVVLGTSASNNKSSVTLLYISTCKVIRSPAKPMSRPMSACFVVSHLKSGFPIELIIAPLDGVALL